MWRTRARQHRRHRRNRDGHTPVGAPHRAIAGQQGGGDHAVDVELLHGQAAADHVGDGVECADLMELDVIDCGAVDLRLGLGERAEDALCPGLHPFRQGSSGKQIADHAVRPMYRSGWSVASE